MDVRQEIYTCFRDFLKGTEISIFFLWFWLADLIPHIPIVAPFNGQSSSTIKEAGAARTHKK